MPRLVLFLALAVFAMGTSEFMLAGVLPAIASDLDVSLEAAGALISGFAAGMVIGAPLTAALARRWPPRAALLLFLAVFAAAHVLGAVTTQFVLFVAGRVVAALANAGFLAVAFTVAVSAAGAERGARALSILLGGTTIAMVAGVPAGAAVGAESGWRSMFWIVAALCVPPFVAIAVTVRRRPPGDADTSRPELRSELAALGTRPLAPLLALTAVVNAGTFGVLAFLAPRVTATLGEGWVPLVLMVFGLGACIGVMLVGRIADRRPWALLAAAAPLLVVAWLGLAAGGGSAAVLVVVVGVAGVLAFATGGTLITLAVGAARSAPTMGGSYATAALNVGAVAGPVVAGVAVGVHGIDGPAWCAAAGALLAVCGVAVVRRACSSTSAGPAGERASAAR